MSEFSWSLTNGRGIINFMRISGGNCLFVGVIGVDGDLPDCMGIASHEDVARVLLMRYLVKR